MATRILIRTPNHLGDCVMALPMISEAREAHPGSHVTVLTPENLVDLYSGNPAIDDILTIPSKYVHGLIAVMKIKDIIAPHRFDLGYVLPPSFGAASAFKLGGVRERVGYIADGRRLLLTRPLALPTPLNSVHRSETYYNLLRRGAQVDLKHAPPQLFLGDDAIAQGGKLLFGFGLDQADQYVVVAFQSVAESRNWGTDNFVALSKRLISDLGCKIVLIGAESDQSTGNEIMTSAGAGEVVNLAGKTTLLQLAAIISGAQVFVGNDSGPAHLAAAVGAPAVVLFGAGDPGETGPLSKSCRILFAEDLDCLGCVKNNCPLKGDNFMQCMKQVSVDTVVQTVLSLIKATR